jgi:hypothetical protein
MLLSGSKRENRLKYFLVVDSYHCDAGSYIFVLLGNVADSSSKLFDLSRIAMHV